MKKLKDLVFSYGERNISKLVDFTKTEILLLPDNQEYVIEMQDDGIHIYGKENRNQKVFVNGEYSVTKLSGYYKINTGNDFGDVYLHADIKNSTKKEKKDLTSKFNDFTFSESRESSSESHYFPSESSESRETYTMPSESRESSIDYGESRGNSYNSGESRESSYDTGESRTNYNSPSYGESHDSDSSGESRW